MNKNKIISIIAILVLGLLTGCAAPTPIREAITIRVAYTSEADFLDLPSLMAHDELTKQGYTIETLYMAETELAVEALARGDADIAAGAMNSFWEGASKGAEISTIMEHNGNSWSIYSTLDINTCADLDGKRFGISSEGAVSTALTKAYVLLNCPEAAPQYLIIGRSSERAAALIAGEIDATALELADTVNLEMSVPGQFHALSKFAEDLPSVRTTGIHVNNAFAAAHTQAVKDYIQATLLVHRQLASDTNQLATKAETQLGLEADIVPALISAHMAVKSWDVNGGLNEQAVKDTLEFFTNSGDLDPGLSLEQLSNLEYLNAVLDEIGRK